jgi:YfiH family protein
VKVDNFIQPLCPLPANVQVLMSVKASLGNSIPLPSTSPNIKQVHGINIMRAPFTGTFCEADGIITCRPQTVISIATADCLPIIFWHNAGLEVGAMHAGWRGLAAGIITQGLAQLTYSASQYTFWLGPCISERAFEVGAEVIDNFATHGWDATILAQSFIPQANAKFLGNLRLLANHALTTGAKINISQIVSSELCTYLDTALFYSYRRSQTSGRMKTFIWING